MATRMIPGLSEMPYEERLKRLRLTTLKERRERGDLITMYKLVHGLEKLDREDLITRDEGRTRGHSYKLRKIKGLKDVKKFSFPNRSLEAWNSLKEEVVAAGNIHMFKQKLDESRYGDRTERA